MAMGNARWAAVVAMAAVVVVAMVGAGVAGADCSGALTGLSGCVPFLTDPTSTPDTKTCCQPLQTVLTSPSSVQCLCSQVNNTAYKNAVLLPSACKLNTTISASTCSTTPSTATPSTATPNTMTTPGSGGFMSASPYAPFIMAMVFLCAAASFLS